MAVIFMTCRKIRTFCYQIIVSREVEQAKLFSNQVYKYTRFFVGT